MYKLLVLDSVSGLNVKLVKITLYKFIFNSNKSFQDQGTKIPSTTVMFTTNFTLNLNKSYRSIDQLILSFPIFKKTVFTHSNFTIFTMSSEQCLYCVTEEGLFTQCEFLTIRVSSVTVSLIKKHSLKGKIL